MAKTQSLFPAQYDTSANHAPNEGLDVDRQPEDILASRAVDLIEDAIYELEKFIGDGAGNYDFDGQVTINEAGADKDFRVEGVGSANALFVQGSDGKVGVGSNRTEVDGSATATAVSANQLLVSRDGYDVATLVHSGAADVNKGPNLNFAARNDAGETVRIANITGRTSAVANGGESGYLDFYTKPATGITSRRMRIDAVGKVLINDNVNALALGPSLTIDGEGQDGQYIMLEDSTDVAHGITTHAETSTFLVIAKDFATKGGAIITALKSEATPGDGYNVLTLKGFAGNTGRTQKNDAGYGTINLIAAEKSGTTVTNCAADVNMVSILDYDAVRFIFDKEGEMHSDAIIGIGDDWDEWDDLQLASDISRLPKAKFNEMVRYRGKDFERAGLLTLSIDEQGTQHAFIRHKAMLQFSMCCFAEIADKLKRYERAFEKLGINQRELLALAN